ncbi:hypothetical protein NB723_003824 [Xanthomonas sacchari]|nr:hypothetical protein [Xanthomonas sacchari]
MAAAASRRPRPRSKPDNARPPAGVAHAAGEGAGVCAVPVAPCSRVRGHAQAPSSVVAVRGRDRPARLGAGRVPAHACRQRGDAVQARDIGAGDRHSRLSRIAGSGDDAAAGPAGAAGGAAQDHRVAGRRGQAVARRPADLQQRRPAAVPRGPGAPRGAGQAVRCAAGAARPAALRRGRQPAGLRRIGAGPVRRRPPGIPRDSRRLAGAHRQGLLAAGDQAAPAHRRRPGSARRDRTHLQPRDHRDLQPLRSHPRDRAEAREVGGLRRPPGHAVHARGDPARLRRDHPVPDVDEGQRPRGVRPRPAAEDRGAEFRRRPASRIHRRDRGHPQALRRAGHVLRSRPQPGQAGAGWQGRPVAAGQRQPQPDGAGLHRRQPQPDPCAAVQGNRRRAAQPDPRHRPHAARGRCQACAAVPLSLRRAQRRGHADPRRGRPEVGDVERGFAGLGRPGAGVDRAARA